MSPNPWPTFFSAAVHSLFGRGPNTLIMSSVSVQRTPPGLLWALYSSLDGTPAQTFDGLASAFQ
jgi:hypothetical protein